MLQIRTNTADAFANTSNIYLFWELFQISKPFKNVFEISLKLDTFSLPKSLAGTNTFIGRANSIGTLILKTSVKCC